MPLRSHTNPIIHSNQFCSHNIRMLTGVNNLFTSVNTWKTNSEFLETLIKSNNKRTVSGYINSSDVLILLLLITLILLILSSEVRDDTLLKIGRSNVVAKRPFLNLGSF